MKKATDAELTAAYAELRNVHKVGERFSMHGSSVHERLVRLGLSNHRDNLFTADEEARIRLEYGPYAAAGKLAVLAAEMGRPKTSMARIARKMGLTIANRQKPYLADGASASMKRWHASNEHPRGMLGKKHSKAFRDAMSQRGLEHWHSLSKDQQVEHSRKRTVTWKGGWRDIGGKRNYYRSSWEANYARYLEWMKARNIIASWDHEPETFWFEAIKRGCRTYLPDFKVCELNGSVAYHEVKGWMDDRSKTKIKRMKKYHPTVKLIVIDSKCYKSIAKTMSTIVEGWE